MGKSANLPAKSASAGQRCITRLSFEGNENTTMFVDLGLALSMINQKHFRSGVYYYVASVEVYNNEQGVMDIHTLPDNYATKNAWRYVFRKHMEMNRLAPNTPRGKWNDFRVYLSNLHRTTGTMAPSLYGVNASHRPVASEEGATGQQYLYSMFTTADDDGDATQEADNFYCHMIGDHVGSAGNWSSVGAIKSYNTIRSQIDGSGEPVVHSDADTDPIQNMFDFSSEEMINDIIINLDARGDEPPYDITQLQGEDDESMQHVARCTTEPGLGRTTGGAGFCAPLGLVCLDPQNYTSAWRVVFNLVPGSYHGVHAERCI